MARGKTQTAPGEAVYLLRESLRVPSSGDTKFRWLPAGTEATAGDLAGLVLPALESGGLISKVSDAAYSCDACQNGGTADEKKAVYSAAELAAHYGETHPGLAPPEGG